MCVASVKSTFGVQSTTARPVHSLKDVFWLLKQGRPPGLFVGAVLLQPPIAFADGGSTSQLKLWVPIGTAELNSTWPDSKAFLSSE